MAEPPQIDFSFNETRDELDAYLKRFERVALSQGWLGDEWASSLGLCLSGEALSLIGRFSAEDASDYTTFQQTLLQHFRYTEEGYRVTFQQSKPRNSETARQFAGRLFGYFDHWPEMAETAKTYEALRDKVVAEHFLKQCHENLAVFLKERSCRDVDTLAKTTDCYLEAQGLTNLAKGTEEKGLSKPLVPAKDGECSSGKAKHRCFLCGKQGHRTADCWTRTRGPKAA